MLTENSFERLSDDIVLIAEDLTLSLLERLSKIAEQLAEDPMQQPTQDEIVQQVANEWGFYNDKAQEWTDENLPEAYLRGIQKTNGEVAQTNLTAQAGAFSSVPLLSQRNTGGEIAAKAADILEEYPEHHTIYSVFQQAAYDDFSKTRLPVIRDMEDKLRELTIQASESAYRDADTFTRRQMSQELMRRFADENITGIRYADGRIMNLDSYSEMVARTQTGNAAREAVLKRGDEYGIDLVQVSVHYPCSDLCLPHQGGAYSKSGNSNKYPPFSQTNPGAELLHPNCKHSVTNYIEGISELPEQDVSDQRNREMYEAQQRQREIERKIRSWKRRKATAITEDAQQKAQSYISKWQSEQRDLIDNNSFLRRKYGRESV